MRTIEHFIAGQDKAGASGRRHDVFDPNTGEVQAQVSLASAAEIDAAVAAAAAAFPAWAATNPQRRARVMFAFKRLVDTHMNAAGRVAVIASMARSIADSEGRYSAWPGSDRVRLRDSAFALEGRIHGRGRARDRHVYSMRQPLGVGAGITPFNFPAMIPMWMFGVAIAVRQHLRSRSLRRRDPSVPVKSGGAVPGGRRGRRRSNVSRRVERGAWRQGSRWMRSSIIPDSEGGEFRRLVRHRALCLPARRGVRESACRRWAARRTTASFCRTRTWTRW
jgi:hypothetical protein